MRETRFELAHPLRDKALDLAHLTIAVASLAGSANLCHSRITRGLLELIERFFKYTEAFFK